jgi:dihydrofolate reductase
MKIALIVAMASNRAIGLDGQMPWHLSADLRRFKRITMGHPVLMGRKTYQAIGKPLPGRANWIISRNPDFSAPGCRVFGDIGVALAQDVPQLFVIGGATLYEALLPQAEELHLTLIERRFDGDTFFPELDLNAWQLVDEEIVNDDASVDFNYRFVTYRR